MITNTRTQTKLATGTTVVQASIIAMSLIAFSFPATTRAVDENQNLTNEPPIPVVIDVCSNLEGAQATLPEGYTESDGVCTEIEQSPDIGDAPPPATATIRATKVVCDSEADLPNMSGGLDITSTTAQDVVTNSAGTCHIEENWEFQWALDGVDNYGNNADDGGPGWTTFFADTSTTIPADVTVWVRERMQEGYVRFSGADGSDVSAEMYCSDDVLYYDNYDHIDPTVAGNTYYCVAFNALVDTGGDDGGSGETATTTPTVTETTSGGGGGGGHKKKGAVLGASTSCNLLLTTHMKMGWENDLVEVMELQNFLNGEMGMNLLVNGIFDTTTDEAVHAFQKKYWEKVLQPWWVFADSGIHDEDDSTGFVYKTTRWMINDIVCPGSEALPALP